MRNSWKRSFFKLINMGILIRSEGVGKIERVVDGSGNVV